MLIVLFGFFAILHRYAEVKITDITLVFILFTLALFLVTVWMVHREENKIVTWMDNIEEKRRQKLARPSASSLAIGSTTSKALGEETSDPSIIPSISRGQTRQSTNKKFGVDVKNFNQTFNTEVYLMRSLTMLFFIVSYVFAGTLMDFHSWEEYPEKQLLSVCLFGFVYVLLTFLMRTWVPTFLALMSLPPYVDEANIQHLFKVLLDDHSIPGSLIFSAKGQTVAENAAAISQLRARTDSETAQTQTLAQRLDMFEERLNELEAENALLRGGRTERLTTDV